MKYKNLLFLTIGLLIAVTLSSHAQHQVVTDFYEDYESKNDVHKITLGEGVIDVMAWVASWDESDEEAVAMQKIMDNLEGIVIMVIPAKYAPAKRIGDVQKRLKKDRFDELMNLREGNSYLTFYAQGEKNSVRDMVIFVEDEDDFVILSLKGTLDLEDMKYFAKHHENVN